MFKKIALFAFILFTLGLNAQEENTFRYKTMLKATATISPGYMLNSPQTNLYIDGDLEYFMEDKVSFRSEVYVMVGTQTKPAILQDNSSLLWGGFYHMHKNRFDFFVGLQTGMNFTKPNDVILGYAITSGPSTITANSTETYNYKVLPVISPMTGITFYVSDYFNFFLNARYVGGAKYFGYTNGSTLMLDEIRISAGLGFQIHVKKESK